MKPGLRRTALVEVIRYLGASQAGPAVILHGAWMLLALAVWQHANAGATGADFTRPLLRAFAWLGGTDAQGVGSGANLLVVFAKISAVLYLIEAMADRVFGPRAPVRLWVVVLVSGGISFVGYGLSFLGGGGGSTGELLLLGALFAVLAGLATGWAVLARRLAGVVIRQIEVDGAAPSG